MKCFTEAERQAQRAGCKKWYEKNREKHIARVSSNQKANRKQRSAYQRLWWSKNAAGVGRYRETRRKWRINNRAHVNKLSREYAKANRPSRRALESKRRVLENAAAINLAAIRKWMKSILKKPSSTCYYCQNDTPRSSIHFDHIIPLSRGGNHSPENLCVACKSCNQLKGSKTLLEWFIVGQQMIPL